MSGTLSKVDAQNVKWILEEWPGLTVAELAEVVNLHGTSYRMIKALCLILDNVINTQATMMHSNTAMVITSMANAYGAAIDADIWDDEDEIR